jgi:hypothetical protein
MKNIIMVVCDVDKFVHLIITIFRMFVSCVIKKFVLNVVVMNYIVIQYLHIAVKILFAKIVNILMRQIILKNVLSVTPERYVCNAMKNFKDCVLMIMINN